MSKQQIDITQTFNAPVEEIFNILTDHEAFGKLMGANITRVMDSEQKNKNGLGSVRRIRVVPLLAFEESVVTFKTNEIMEYVISKGSPLKNHRGSLRFTADRNKTSLHYHIEFEPKLPIPGLGGALKNAIEKPLRLGLSKLAQRFSQPQK